MVSGLEYSMLFPSYFCYILLETRKRCRDFPGGSDCKKSTCNAGDLGSIPGLGRSPGGGHGNPLQYSCLENPSPWAEEPGGLQSMGSHDWGTTHNQHRRYSLLLKAKIARKLNVKVRDRFLPNRKKVKLYWEKIVKLHIYSGLYPPESCSGTPVRCEFCFLRYCECLSQLHLFIQKERKERTLEPGWLKEKKVEHKKKELWQQSTLDAGIFTNFVKSGNQAGEVVENSTLM